MHYSRHISATQKELAGGQILGATYDYTHRLLNMDLEHSRPQCELPKSVITAPHRPLALSHCTQILSAPKYLKLR